MKIEKLHDYSKDANLRQAKHFCHGGKDVIRKLEIAEYIASLPGVKCIKTAAKNSIVYAAVETVNESGEKVVSAKIYDTTVFQNGSRHMISFVEYDEKDFMSMDEYETMKGRLEDYEEGSREREKLIDRLNNEKKYVLPTGCHSSILKLLTPTAYASAKKWRMECQDVLDSLAAEKLTSDSLTNLPLLSKIKLSEIHSDGTPIYLIKDNEGSFKYPVWIDDDSGKKYKINEIQRIGFEIIDRG